MIILDTNIVSEFMTAKPQASVLQWLDEQVPTTLYISTITIAEIGYGLRSMPSGKRQRLLSDAFERLLNLVFGTRILSFDDNAARCYGQIMGQRKALGRPMSICDGQIAAIAQATHFLVATRNTKDFEQCGIALINPFK